VRRLNQPELAEPNPRTTPELLQSLCELQGVRIAELHATIDKLEAANAKISGELLDASAERKKVLMMLQSDIQHLRDVSKTVCHQRDTIERCLRGLHRIASVISTDKIPDLFLVAWLRAMRDTEELLIVIDQLKEGKRDDA